MGLIVLIIIVVVVALLAIRGIYVVPQQRIFVIERFGKFHKTSGAGIHIMIPFIDQVAGKMDLRTQQSSFSIDAKTKDNVTITLEVAVQYRVSEDAGSATDPRTGVVRAFYILADPVQQMQSYIVDALRSAIPGHTLDGVFDEKDAIAQKVNSDVSAEMLGYGYVIVSTLITSIGLPTDVRDSMNEINAAERQKVAAISLAEAERIRVVTEARARAEAAEQAGIGVANQRKAIAEGIKGSLDSIKEAGVTTNEANLLFMYTQWCDLMTAFAESGKSSTVVLPADFRESASMFEQILTAQNSTTQD